MNLKLAFRNVLRHRTRSLISILAIASAVISLVLVGGFIQDTVTTVRELYIQAFLGHLRIYKPGYRRQGLLHPFDYMISEPDQVIEDLRSIPQVRYVSPRLGFGGLLSTGDTTLAVIIDGLNPALEQGRKNSVSMEKGETLRANGDFDVLLGKGIAAAIDSHPGDALVLVTSTRRGALNALDLTVRGIFSTADKAYDDHAVRIPLGTAQKLLKTAEVQTVAVFLDKTSQTDSVRSAILDSFKRRGWDYEVQPWYELEEADYILKVVSFYRRIFLVLNMIMVVVVTLSIANTMNMAVFERIGEIGTLRAIGTKQSGIAGLFLAEGLVFGLLGGVVGIFGGSILAAVISKIGIPMPTAPGSTASWTAHVAIVPSVLALAFGIALVTALVSSVLPAMKAAKLEIAEALRHNI